MDEGWWFYPKHLRRHLKPELPSERLTAKAPALEQAMWRRGYWVPDMRKACFSGRHLALTLGLALPALLAFSIGIPLIFWAMLFWRRADIRAATGTAAQTCIQEVGFMYRPNR